MHPYKGKPDYQFWARAGGITNPLDLDPVTDPAFHLAEDDRIVTAGSCFAQHISRRLTLAGFNYLVTESAHPLIPADQHTDYGYGVFSARYGNIYTARQLWQLLMRSYGEFNPAETVWTRPDGRFVDPFRPNIHPRGYPSVGELLADRKIHFDAVRRAMETGTVLVFTLGLTEAWPDKRDGAVFPLAPGVAGGDFNPDLHEFRNFGVSETVDDVVRSIEFLRVRNPGLKVILTVSPVPLNATALPRHVLVSTTYSKAVLRVAAEEAAATLENVMYFPSYEIITSPHVRGRYYAADCRSVTEEGVDHVMSVFLRHYAPDAVNRPVAGAGEASEADRALSERHLHDMEGIMRVVCDEESIRP